MGDNVAGLPIGKISIGTFFGLKIHLQADGDALTFHPLFPTKSG